MFPSFLLRSLLSYSVGDETDLYTKYFFTKIHIDRDLNFHSQGISGNKIKHCFLFLAGVYWNKKFDTEKPFSSELVYS